MDPAHQYPPLGGYAPLKHWAGLEMPWGPDGDWGMTVGDGAGVLDRLADLIADGPRRVRERYSLKAEPWTVTLGCMPWLTSERVTAALIRAGNHCICLDKSTYHGQAVRALLANDAGVANYFIPRLRDTYRAGPDGSGPIIGPGSPSPEENGECLEPVRVVGWSPQPGKKFPLLHAKVIVICAAWRWENDFGSYDDHLTPIVGWWGSANWTEKAAEHIEIGAWTTDEAACKTLLDFVVDVIRLSESPTSATVGPEPDLVAARWDDAAFAEYYAEYYDDREADLHEGDNDE